MVKRVWLVRFGLIAGAVCAVAAVAFGLVEGIDRWAKASRSGPVHVYHLRPAPPFLPDAVGLEKARETLARDGYDLDAWQPWEDDRSAAPNGARDRYLSRNAYNPNHATILFRDRTGTQPNPTRIVQLDLKGDRLECFVVLPK